MSTEDGYAVESSEAVRRVVLPPKLPGDPDFTLVLDLDDTILLRSEDNEGNADFKIESWTEDGRFHPGQYVKLRPHLEEFLERVSQIYEVIIFTASTKIRAEKCLDRMDPEGRIFKHRLYRRHCTTLGNGNFVKDLTVLGRDLSKTVMVDDNYLAFTYQPDNGILARAMTDMGSVDDELKRLLPILEEIVQKKQDVRISIRQKRQEVNEAKAILEEKAVNSKSEAVMPESEAVNSTSEAVKPESEAVKPESEAVMPESVSKKQKLEFMNFRQI